VLKKSRALRGFSFHKNIGEEKYMKISRNKTTATAISLFLMLTMVVSLVALPAASNKLLDSPDLR
jgi:hypothetical protein